MNHPLIEDGVERLRTKWPQTHAVPSKYGAHLIVVPSVILPKGYDKNICTILFVAPPGFPAACPNSFFTDIEIRLENKAVPYHSQPPDWSNAKVILREWPQWTHCQWWKWCLQMWNPNQSNLYTYMRVIQQRLQYIK